MKRSAIVLCGGRSSRMKRPKAWLPWFGSTMVEHVVAQLAAAVDEIVIVTSEEVDLPPFDAVGLVKGALRVVQDRESGLGPLAGIREGLAALDSGFAFVTSTDAPFIDAGYVRGLMDRERACAPISGGFVQVLSAVYPVSAAKRAEELLASSRPRPLSLLEDLDYEAIDEAELPTQQPTDRLSQDVRPWHGFNTPQAYLECVRSVDSNATAEVELLGRAALVAKPAIRRLPVGTLGELLDAFPRELGLVNDGRVSKDHIASLGGRELVRDLDLPIGPGERVSVLDALAGG